MWYLFVSKHYFIIIIIISLLLRLHNMLDNVLLPSRSLSLSLSLGKCSDDKQISFSDCYLIHKRSTLDGTRPDTLAPLDYLHFEQRNWAIVGGRKKMTKCGEN